MDGAPAPATTYNNTIKLRKIHQTMKCCLI